MLVVLDGTSIRSELDLHDELARQLDFGPYYGRNLDALWDRLYRDVERPVEVVWQNSEASRAAIGEQRFAKVAALLVKVMDADKSHDPDDRFTIRFE